MIDEADAVQPATAAARSGSQRAEVAMRQAFVDVLVAVRSVIRQPRRSAMGFLAVGMGVLAYLLAAGFIEWMYYGLREGTIKSGLGHLQVNREGYRAGGRADPYRYLLPDGSARQAALETLPGVVTVAPRLAFSGLASVGDATISFIGEGIVPEREGALAGSVDVVAGKALRSDDPDGILLGQGLARTLQAKEGDPVVLLVTTQAGGVNAVEGRVRGIFSTVTKAYDDTALRVTLPLAQRLLRTQGAHTWVVLLDDTTRTDVVARELRTQLAGSGLEVNTWRDLADFYTKSVALLSRQVTVVKWMIGVIIILGISNTLFMNVTERTGEIGTAMALGAKRRQILRRFVVEGVVIGALGGLAGVALGTLLAHAISQVGIPMPPPPGMARGYVAEIMVTWSIVLDAVLLALVTTLVASIIPAWRASRMNIVAALRSAR